MMSTQHRNTSTAAYRWNPYGSFSKVTLGGNDEHQLCLVQQQTSTRPTIQQHHPVAPSVIGFAEIPTYDPTSSPATAIPPPALHHVPAPTVIQHCRSSLTSSSATDSDEGVSNSDEGSSATGATANTQLNDAEHMQLVLQWVNYARSLSCDEHIDREIAKLSYNVQCEMLQLILCGNKKVFFDLCTAERGNVVTQLLRSVTDEPQFQEATVALLEEYWHALTQSQFGAIALTRLFQVLPEEHQYRLAKLTLQSATELALHPYGNFMVSEVVKTASVANNTFDFVFPHLAQVWSAPMVFGQLAQSRFGSHVLEACAKAAPGEYLNQLCSNLILTETGLEVAVRLGFDKQGNYPLQAVLRAMAASPACGDLIAQARINLAPRLDASQHGRNLRRAMEGPNNSHTRKTKNAAAKGLAGPKPAALPVVSIGGSAPFPTLVRY